MCGSNKYNIYLESSFYANLIAQDSMVNVLLVLINMLKISRLLFGTVEKYEYSVTVIAEKS